MQKHDCEKANCVQRTCELVLLEHKVRNEYYGKLDLTSKHGSDCKGLC